MTISTEKGSSISISFLVFNFAVFLALKFLVLNKIFEHRSIMFVYVTIVFLALTSSSIYVLINIYRTHKFEEIIMKMSMYVKEHKCNLFIGNENICFLRFGGIRSRVYINQLYFIYTQYHSNRAKYISQLKARFMTLSKIDKLYIYVYRYIKEILTSISILVIYQVCDSIKRNDSSDVVLTLIILILLVLLSKTIIEIVLMLVNRSIKNRNLELFISK